MKKLNSVEVKVGNAVREVSVEILGPKYSKGYVGKAFFCWKSDQYDAPFVRIKGKAADGRARYLVKLFLMEYKRMLLENKKSPLHFNECTTESRSTSTSNGNQSISGVPHWMREEHKVWTECFYKDGSGSYFRRTRFKPESKELVEKYLPYCSQCPFRVNCEKPCEEPDLMCQSEIFRGKEETLQDEIQAVVAPKTKGRKTTAFYLNKNIQKAECSECGVVHENRFNTVRYDSLEELLKASESIDKDQVEEIRAHHYEDVPVYGYEDSITVSIDIKAEKDLCLICSAEDIDDVF